MVPVPTLGSVLRDAQAIQIVTAPCIATLRQRSVSRFLELASRAEPTFLAPLDCNARLERARTDAQAILIATVDTSVRRKSASLTSHLAELAIPRQSNAQPISSVRLESALLAVRVILTATLRITATLTRKRVCHFPELDNHAAQTFPVALDCRACLGNVRMAVQPIATAIRDFSAT